MHKLEFNNIEIHKLESENSFNVRFAEYLQYLENLKSWCVLGLVETEPEIGKKCIYFIYNQLYSIC